MVYQKMVGMSLSALVLAFLCGCTSHADTLVAPSATSGEHSPSSSPSAPAGVRSSIFAIDRGGDEYADGASARNESGVYTYTIAKGDTINGIAVRYGICLADLYFANQGLEGHQSEIQPGQKLSILAEPVERAKDGACLGDGTVFY